MMGGGGGGGGGAPCTQPATADAPTGFDDITNGFIPQGSPPPECGEPTPGNFLGDKAIFEEVGSCRRWTGSSLQRSIMQRMPPESGDRRD